MDAKIPGPENEFTFIQEKVVPRKKNKVKKAVVATVSTLCLATIFGFVARIVFIKSEGLVNRLLGIDTTKRTEILLSNEGNESGQKGQMNASVTIVPGGSVAKQPTIAPTPIVTKQPEVTPVPTVTSIPKEPDSAETHIDATAEDYEHMLLDIKKIAGNVSSSLVMVTAVESKKDWVEEPYEARQTTTGIIIGNNTAELLILTTLDKVLNANIIEVTMNGGAVVGAQMWNYDESFNLAVIAVKLKDITPSQLASVKEAEFGESYSIALGSAIIALGQPNGNSGSMELGMITGKEKTFYIMDNRLDLFTTDITNNANSDGVIVNMQGQIIGMITQSLSEGANSSVSTAIGISRLKSVIEKLINKYDRILFGITGEDIPATVLAEFGLINGIYITKVVQDTPAFEAGIKQGDIITGINEYSVSSVTSFASILNNYNPEDSIDVIIQRKSKGEFKEITIPLILGKKEIK